MAINFTQNAKLVIDRAKELASETGGTIGTEHILYGLTCIESSECRSLLEQFGITTARVMQYLEKTDNCYTVEMSPKAKRTLENADNLAASYNETFVSPEYILVALLGILDGLAFQIIVSLSTSITELMEKAQELLEGDEFIEENFYQNVEKNVGTENYKMDNIAKAFKDLFGNGGSKGGVKSEVKIAGLDCDNDNGSELGVELVRLAELGRLDGAIGRERELARMVQILCRRTKNNPVLIGEAGVGKTAVVEELAIMIATKKAPDAIKHKKIFSLNIGGLLSGTKYRGEFEEKLTKLLKSITADKNTILFIDELHSIVGAGKAEGAVDLANLLKPLLARGEMQTIGATTIEEYRKYIEKDSALERRFQAITVEPPSVEETVAILEGIKEKYEKHHKVKISHEAVIAAATLADRYISDRFLPDKAIDIMDEAASKKRLKTGTTTETDGLDEKIAELNARIKMAIDAEEYAKAGELKKERTKLNVKKAELMSSSLKPISEVVLTKDDVAALVAEMTGIPHDKISEEEGAKLVSLENEVNKRIVGQENASKSICAAIRRSRAGLSDKNRPLGVFIFVGASGVGKTEMAKCIAETVFGSQNQLIRLDMSEYAEKTSINRLIGAAPGYIGYDEGGQLTEKVRRKPYSVVLFDEIEKAHKDVYNLLLSVTEDGTLTDSHGRKISFKNTIIIMTSNLGLDADGRAKIGFLGGEEDKSQALCEELGQRLSVELVSRIDCIVPFCKLSKSNLENIARLMIGAVVVSLSEKNIELVCTETVYSHIATMSEGGKGGARDVRKCIMKEIESRLAEYILNHKVMGKQKIKIDIIDGKIKIDNIDISIA